MTRLTNVLGAAGLTVLAVWGQHAAQAAEITVMGGMGVISGVRDLAEFRGCIAGVSGRIEAMAVVGDDCEIEARAMGIPYVCAPGEMQSPPLDWRHGGGAFIDMMVGSR